MDPVTAWLALEAKRRLVRRLVALAVGAAGSAALLLTAGGVSTVVIASAASTQAALTTCGTASGGQATGTGAALARSAASSAGFPAAQLDVAVAVAGAESGYNPAATNHNTNGSTDYGMWQINSAHADLLGGHDWRDPSQNAWMAFQVWRQAGGSWTPWATFNSGAYRQYLPAGSTAPSAASAPACTSPPAVAGTRTVTDPHTGVTVAVPIVAGPAGVAVNAALDQVGVPYSWGGGGWPQGPSHGVYYGSGTKGFDCSGLTEYAWGVALHRSIGGDTSAQLTANPAVTSTPQPGDLAFHPGHEAMYLGRVGGVDTIVEAPHTGAWVHVTRLWFVPTDWRRPA